MTLIYYLSTILLCIGIKKYNLTFVERFESHHKVNSKNRDINGYVHQMGDTYIGRYAILGTFNFRINF